ncbi:MAG TPA: mechanosensitive ion channel domain-containing protein [Ramlibacter sp.]|uniref:mechanosensitive ion channel family protein n=1 Tax=Ramlibacter sp. TaxID=1917967 RepID=UPI002ED2962A
MTPLELTLDELNHPRLLWETFVLLACLGVAYGLAWLTGRHRRAEDSVWFGKHLFDGLLFPLIALGLAYSARVGFAGLQKVPLLRLAVPVLLSLVAIRLLARVFPLVFPRSPYARQVERWVSWLVWLVAVLWILGLLPAVMAEMEGIRFALGKTKVTLLGIVQGVLSAGLVLVLALWLSATLERKVLRDAVADLSLRKVTVNAMRAILLTLGFLFALSAAGVDLTALSVLGGALGVGIGFGLQKLAANYVSGFVILAERSVRIGDTVRVEGFEGIVADIKTRYTLIRAADGRASVVPNEKLITERVENLSLADPRMLLTCDVAVGYDSDVQKVQDLLVEAAVATQRVLTDPPPSCRLVAFGADGLEFRVLFWIDDPQNGQLNVRSDVNLRILRSLRQAGIDIPYPQRVLHVRPAAPGAFDATVLSSPTLNASAKEARG